MMQSLSNLLSAGKALADAVDSLLFEDDVTFAALMKAKADYDLAKREYDGQNLPETPTKAQKIAFMVNFEMSRGCIDNTAGWTATKESTIDHWFNYYQEIVNKQG